MAVGAYRSLYVSLIDALFFFFFFFFQDHLQATRSRRSSSPKRNFHSARFRSTSPHWFVSWHAHNSTSLIFRLDNRILAVFGGMSLCANSQHGAVQRFCVTLKSQRCVCALISHAWRLPCFHSAFKGCWWRIGKVGKSSVWKHFASRFGFTFGLAN